MEIFQTSELFIKLLIPTFFLITVIRMHYFDSDFLTLTDIKCRGSELIEQLQMERIKEQDNQEHRFLDKIGVKMDQINATQQKTQGPMFKEPESQHIVGLCRPDSKEDADYYYSNDDDGDYDEDENDDSYTGSPPVMKSKPLTFEVHPGGTVALPCATVNLTDDLNVFTSCREKRVHFCMKTKSIRGPRTLGSHITDTTILLLSRMSIPATLDSIIALSALLQKWK